jgi:hypothetical protein
MPHLSTAELVIQAARELTFGLLNLAPAAPFTHVGHPQHEALARLVKIFEDIAYPESPSPDLDPVPATTPSFMLYLVPATAPSTKPILVPSPRSAVPVLRMEASLPRVYVPAATPNGHRYLNTTSRTPMPSPKFDIYKHRRKTIIYAARHQA